MVPPKSHSTSSFARITRSLGVVVRAGGVLAGGDDGEVHLVVALLDDAAAQLGRHRGLGAPDEVDLAALELAGDLVDGRAGRGECVDLGLVLRHPLHPDDVDGSGERRVRHVREQLDEEPRPHLIADRDAPGPGCQPPGDGGRILRLPPRQEREHAWLLDHPRRLEPRDDHRRVAVAGHDQHRQPLERHGRVPGEVRQVVADREQERVDALGGHRGAHAVESVEIHGGVDGSGGHAAKSASSTAPPISDQSMNIGSAPGG